MAGGLGGGSCVIMCSCLIFTERKGLSRMGIGRQEVVCREGVENVCVLVTFCCELWKNVYDMGRLGLYSVFSEMEVVCKR